MFNTLKQSHKIPTCILLDRSQSMTPNWKNTISSLNELIDSEKQSSPDTHILVVTFNSTNSFETIYNDTATSCKQLIAEELIPRGMTPLYDAIAQMNKMIESEKLEKCQIFILTDGEENNSKKTSVTDVKEIIDNWNKLKYNITFIGADFDAVTAGSTIGLKHDQSLNFKKGNEDFIFNNLAQASMAYRSTGTTKSYTTEERLEALS